MKKLIFLCMIYILNGCVVAQGIDNTNKINENRKKASDSYLNAMKESYKYEKEFLDCMKNSNKAKSSLNINPSDIAESAVEECKTPLTYYELYRNSYYMMNSVMKGSMVEDRDENTYKVQHDMNELIKNGKRLFINEMINHKTKENS